MPGNDTGPPGGPGGSAFVLGQAVAAGSVAGAAGVVGGGVVARCSTSRCLEM